MPREEHRITNCNAKEQRRDTTRKNSVNIKKSNCDCISFNESGFNSNNIYLGLSEGELKKLFDSGLPSEQNYIYFYFGRRIKVLDSEQILKLSDAYRVKFKDLCIEKARELKMLIIEEYGKNIRGLESVPLSSIFSFSLGKNICEVENQTVRALTVKTLDRTKSELENYRDTIKSLEDSQRISFDKIFNFIEKHKAFSHAIANKFTISNIKFKQDSAELEARSWLYENLRYMFPKKFGFPIDNNLLSWFIHCDSYDFGKVCKVTERLKGREVLKKIRLSELLSIDYRISKLKTKDFKKKGIDITQEKLESLQTEVAYLIYYFIFNEFSDLPYVSQFTSGGLEVGRFYWSPEYFVIRAIFFATAEFNNGIPLTFSIIERNIGLSASLRLYIYYGYSITDNYKNLVKYVEDLLKNRPQYSDVNIFVGAQKTLKEYTNIYYARRRARIDELGEYDSAFEREMHNCLKKEFSPLFVHHMPVATAICKREVILKDENGNNIIKKIHSLFHYDFYLELTCQHRALLGLSEKWQGIAVEAQGVYWHSQIVVQERDKFKRTVSKQENIIEIEIWDNMNRNIWIQEIIDQINTQTGTNITQGRLNKLFKNFSK